MPVRMNSPLDFQQGVEQIPTYTPAQQAAVAQMVANPVSVDDQTVNASASYGTGFAPYFMPLALWVGTLVAFMMFAPLPMRSRVSQYQSSFGAVITGMTPMVIVGIAQVAVLSIVLRFFVGSTPFIRSWLAGSVCSSRWYSWRSSSC